LSSGTVLEGDYSDSEFDDELPSSAPHVDLEQVVEAINDLVGADYSAKYCVSTSIKYNAEEYAPLTSKKDSKQTRSDSKHFDRSKGYGGKRFSQAVFGFKNLLLPCAKLRKGGWFSSRQPSFPVVREYDGVGWRRRGSLHLAVSEDRRKGLTKPPGLLQPPAPRSSRS
jgi:hypothetical protein